MTRRFCPMALAVAVLAVFAMASTAQAQIVSFGLGGVQYRGYGQGYYGGYGQGYRPYGSVYGPRVNPYTVYGNGPYGYGAGSQYQFRSNGNANYSGYGNSGYYPQGYVPAYNPYSVYYYNGF